MLRAARELLAVRSPLDAELMVSEMLGTWWGPQPGRPGERDVRRRRADLDELVGEGLIGYAAGQGSPAALALLSGIDPERVVRTTWIIAAALATLAGTLYGLDKAFKAFNYFQILLPIFAAAIVGGLGSPQGAIAGGFLVAFSEVAVTYPWRKIADYLVPSWQPEGLLQLLSTEYKFAVSFIILIAVLLFRPTGIFRGKSV